MLVLVFFCLNIFKPIRIKLLNLQGVLHYLIYFWLGCLFPIYKDKYRFLYKKIFFISSFLTSLCLTNYILRYTDCLFLDLVKMVTAVIGIAMMMSLVLIISRGKNNFLSFMNGYAYQIFLLHWFFQIFFRVVLYQIFHLGYWLTFSFMFFGGIFYLFFLLNLSITVCHI